MNTELKPCPFCGGEAKLKGICGTETAYAFVFCKNCGSRTEKNFEFNNKEKSKPHESLELAKRYVVDLWNVRV